VCCGRGMRINVQKYDDRMTPGKRRVTVTVDPELVEAGNRAVASGSADSLSAWVNTAMAERARRDEQLARLRDVIADYEAEFGEITAEEMTVQRRVDREHATVVRGRRPSKRARQVKSS
jgi:glycerol dehydrogenase-like iron-containing ADH family enzyme